jgi:hypothetical protein
MFDHFDTTIQSDELDGFEPSQAEWDEFLALEDKPSLRAATYREAQEAFERGEQVFTTPYVDWPASLATPLNHDVPFIVAIGVRAHRNGIGLHGTGIGLWVA